MHYSQQGELLVQVLKSQDSFLDFSMGPGFRHEYSGTNVMLTRAIIGRRFNSWQLYSNLLFEKPFSETRDQIDLFMTVGCSYRILPALQLGFEAVGQDLEGFWEADEAEGGAILFVGPALIADIPAVPWTFSICAGSILRATQSIRTSTAPRDLTTNKKNGFIIHAGLNFEL